MSEPQFVNLHTHSTYSTLFSHTNPCVISATGMG